MPHNIAMGKLERQADENRLETDRTVCVGYCEVVLSPYRNLQKTKCGAGNPRMDYRRWKGGF